jgi:glutamate/tyrosine decarboxylase-like PLP-dependent enzyme
MSAYAVLDRAHDLALRYLDGVAARHVGGTATAAALRGSLGGPLPVGPQDPVRVLEQLASQCDPGIVATVGPRYFGFVTGGAVPVTVAADWLASAWDQNGALYVMSPAVAVVEDIVAGWLLELLGLPRRSSVGFVTGCHMANFTCLAAARHEVLRRVGWNVETQGLQRAPRVTVFVGDEVHVSAVGGLRMLGFGTDELIRIPVDDQGRLRADALADAMAGVGGPAIVCAQAGNVNTGATDPIGAIVDIAHGYRAWVHVDGAFGLWAAAVPELSGQVAGLGRADSWATDAHKWLNVPYDCGVAIVRRPEDLRAAMTSQAAYLIQTAGSERDAVDWTPEFSRRARGIPVYATLRTLGRDGIADLVDRCCGLASSMASLLAASPGVRVLNDVVLNQVLVRFAEDDGITRAVVEGVQREGTCWLSGTNWHGVAAMRISVSNWSTTEDDARRSVAAILRVFRGLAPQG